MSGIVRMYQCFMVVTNLVVYGLHVVVVDFTRLLHRDGGMVKDHGAPEVEKLYSLYQRWHKKKKIAE